MLRLLLLGVLNLGSCHDTPISPVSSQCLQKLDLLANDFSKDCLLSFTLMITTKDSNLKTDKDCKSLYKDMENLAMECDLLSHNPPRRQDKKRWVQRRSPATEEGFEEETPDNEYPEQSEDSVEDQKPVADNRLQSTNPDQVDSSQDREEKYGPLSGANILDASETRTICSIPQESIIPSPDADSDSKVGITRTNSEKIEAPTDSTQESKAYLIVVIIAIILICIVSIMISIFLILKLADKTKSA